MIELLPELLSTFARAGGGGSSSGGGGGELFAMLGYVPSYYTGKLVKKLLPRTAELIVSSISAALMSCVLLWLAYLLHGGLLFMILVIIGIWTGWYAAFFGTWEKIKARARKTRKEVDQAAALDPAWNGDQLIAYTKETFLAYQRDWSNFDTDSMQRYMTHRQFMTSALMLRVLREMHRNNPMAEVVISDAVIVAANDSVANAEDWFQVAIEAKAHDTLRDTESGVSLFVDKSTFTEYWTFIRRDETWLLDRIDQATAELSQRNRSIKNFATLHDFYYALDMGWLFLPNKGVLFSGGRFGKSDINNYVVGLYGEHIMQLYTYTPVEKYDILVGQINLPKSYNGILVRRKPSFFAAWNPPKPPREYRSHKLEWQDFNKRYDVSATDIDRLATFELLNPGFMAYLYDTDPGISIEVADNVVYLYKYIGSQGNTDNSTDYTVLFEILSRAYKELKL